MTWIDDIEKVYLDSFRETFDKLELKRYEQMDGSGAGAVVKFKNNFFKLKLLNDRGIIETDLCSVYHDEGFRSIERYYSLLTLDKSEHLSTFERTKILRTRLSYEEQTSFLVDNFDELGRVLNKNNYKNTLKRIDDLI